MPGPPRVATVDAMALHLTRRVAGAPRHPTSRTSGARPAVDLARQILLMGLAALAYFGVRGLTQGALDAALVNADRVVTMDPARTVLTDAAILVRDGRIGAIGRSVDLHAAHGSIRDYVRTLGVPVAALDALEDELLV